MQFIRPTRTTYEISKLGLFIDIFLQNELKKNNIDCVIISII